MEANMRTPSPGAPERDETIYQHLHTAIAESHLEPGTRLPEDTLAQTFGASRTIIRKVLQRLGHEGLVEIRPNRGAVVAEPSVVESREVFATRRILECGAMGDVVQHASAAALAPLRELVRQEDAAQLKGDRAAAIRLSGEFHVRLAALADNTILQRMVAELVARSSLIIATYGSPIAASCRHSEHEQILDLLEQGDREGATRWMAEHLLHVEKGFAYQAEAPKEADLRQILQRIAGRKA